MADEDELLDNHNAPLNERVPLWGQAAGGDPFWTQTDTDMEGWRDIPSTMALPPGVMEEPHKFLAESVYDTELTVAQIEEQHKNTMMYIERKWWQLNESSINQSPLDNLTLPAGSPRLSPTQERDRGYDTANSVDPELSQSYVDAWYRENDLYRQARARHQGVQQDLGQMHGSMLTAMMTRRSQAQRKARGANMSGTLLSGGLGLTDEARAKRKTLLGG